MQPILPVSTPSSIFLQKISLLAENIGKLPSGLFLENQRIFFN
jgi:hypothetical protein